MRFALTRQPSRAITPSSVDSQTARAHSPARGSRYRSASWGSRVNGSPRTQPHGNQPRRPALAQTKRRPPPTPPGCSVREALAAHAPLASVSEGVLQIECSGVRLRRYAATARQTSPVSLARQPKLTTRGGWPTFAKATVGNLRARSRAKVGGVDKTRTRGLRRDRQASMTDYAPALENRGPLSPILAVRYRSWTRVPERLAILAKQLPGNWM